MLVLTEKLLGYIPGVYPHSCEDRWLINKNEIGTQVRCTNPFCPIKDSHKLKEALDLLEFRINTGNTRSLELVLTLKLKTHMDIFKIACEPLTEETREAWNYYGSKLVLISDQMAARNQNGGFSLAKYMDAWGCEQLGSTRANKIFGRLHDLQEFYDMYDDEIAMCKFIGEKLNNSPYCNTVLNIVYFLRSNKKEILEISRYFVFTKPLATAEQGGLFPTEPISVAITDEVSRVFDANGILMRFKPREKFIPYLESIYGIPLDYHKSLTQKTRFLINDAGNRKGKVQTVKKKAGYRKCVITTSDVFQVVLEVLKGDLSGVYSANQKEEIQTNNVQSW